MVLVSLVLCWCLLMWVTLAELHEHHHPEWLGWALHDEGFYVCGNHLGKGLFPLQMGDGGVGVCYHGHSWWLCMCICVIHVWCGGSAHLQKISSNLPIASHSPSIGGVGKCVIAWIRVLVTWTSLSAVVVVGRVRGCWEVSMSVVCLAPVVSLLPSNSDSHWAPVLHRMLVLHLGPMMIISWV